MVKKDWSLTDIPPKGSSEVASFAESLFEIAEHELERIKKHSDLLANYSLYRGKSAASGIARGKKYQKNTPVNLYFANVERTVANITSRNPTGEVVDLDGIQDGAEKVLSSKLEKWWKHSNQQRLIRSSARMMEIYGATFEKPTWDKTKDDPVINITDPFTFYPAPGFYENLSEDLPFCSFAYLRYKDEVEKEFGVKDLVADEAYDLLGTVRESYKSASGYSPVNPSLTGKYAVPMTKAGINAGGDGSNRLQRCLIKEVWIRDHRIKTVTDERPVIDPQTGLQQVDEQGNPLIEKIVKRVPVYPDGVRKITIAASKDPKGKDKSGYVVLDDCANPNINPALPIKIASRTYPWGRFPIYHANSYRDMVSIWGFSAAEQVGDLIVKINKIISKLVNYVVQVMAPPLIVQKNAGITREMITSQLKKAGRLVLMPTIPNARIEFMEIPNLPATFFKVLELIVNFFDRIYAIEEADRGQAPNGVIAAAAIVALQERNQQLTQAKTTAIESLVENRSRWCIGLYQNFGTATDLVDVKGQPAQFLGVAFAGRKFGYVVETGSTTPRTSLQVQEQAVKLYEMGAIDRQALLENLSFPGWQEIIERAGEGQLNQALQILIAAGLPKEEAIRLKQYLIQPGQGPGGTNTKAGGTPGVQGAVRGQGSPVPQVSQAEGQGAE